MTAYIVLMLMDEYADPHSSKLQVHKSSTITVIFQAVSLMKRMIITKYGSFEDSIRVQSYKKVLQQKGSTFDMNSVMTVVADTQLTRKIHSVDKKSLGCREMQMSNI